MVVDFNFLNFVQGDFKASAKLWNHILIGKIAQNRQADNQQETNFSSVNVCLNCIQDQKTN